jgi:hypothetical protein
MDRIGMNPAQAASGGERTMSLAESFGSLKGDLTASLERCIAAAGEPEVTGGYGDFGEKWATDLSATAAHGESIGGNAKITVADGTGTDLANAGGYAVAPPPVAPPGINLS